MFILSGNITQLIRYKIEYNEGMEICTTLSQKDYIEEHLNSSNIEFSTTVVDQTENEWFDGLTFGSYDEAREALEAGESAYRASSITLEERITAAEQAILMFMEVSE